MKVESISIYPVKSTTPTPLTSSFVELSGLRHDRRWMLVDSAGARFSASKCTALLGVTAIVNDDGSLVLSSDGLESLEVDVPSGGVRIPVTVSRLSTAVDAGDAAAEWFSKVAGRHVRLIWQDDPSQRLIGSTHGALGDESVSFADVGPLLLTTTASLAQLNEWIATDHEPEAMAMSRFRPNVVVDGDIAPFAEDGWKRIRIGNVAYRFAEHCDRCVVTTIDPLTLKHGKEPIRTLARHRKWDGRTWFGIRIIPLGTGMLSMGDEVVVEEAGS